MDYGRTTTPLPMSSTPTPGAPTTLQSQKENNLFASAITPGIGVTPEDPNPNLSTNQDFGRTNQASIGSTALNAEPYLPPEINPNSASLAGITEATRINDINELSQPQGIKQQSLAQPETQTTLASDEPMQPSKEEAELEIETITPAEKPVDDHSSIDYGKHFTVGDIGVVESAIRKHNLTDLYKLVQNTREKDQNGGKN